jgi:DNA-binding FadR family transcriptional regulator
LVSTAQIDFGGFTGRGPKTAARVASHLRRRIISGELRSGDALPKEVELTEALGISRPTLREAFRILEAEQLLEIRRGVQGGPRVRTPVAEVPATYVGLMLQLEGVRLKDVYDARTVLEAPAAAALAADPKPEAIARLRDNLARANELLGEPLTDIAERMSQLSQEFHTLLVELAGNRTLHIFDTMMYNILASANRSYVDAQADDQHRRRAYQVAVKSHTRLVDLIEDGEAEAADGLWRRHLDEIAKRLLEGGPASGLVVDLLS